MEAKISEAAPTGWLATAAGSWRIRSHARDFEIIQQAIGGGPDPARMSRFDCDAAIELFPQ